MRHDVTHFIDNKKVNGVGGRFSDVFWARNGEVKGRVALA